MLWVKKIRYRDRETGLEAFSLLAPLDWESEGGITWHPDNPMMPAKTRYSVSSEDGGLRLEFLPGQSFFWSNLSVIQLSFPAGSKYLGTTVCPLLDADEVLVKIVIPQFRGGVEDLKVVSLDKMEGVTGPLGVDTQFVQYSSSVSGGARARIEYAQNGKSYEEYLGCAVIAFNFLTPVEQGSIRYTIWMIDYVHSLRAEKGNLDKHIDLFRTMLYSYRIGRAWFEKYERIISILKERQMQKLEDMRQVIEALKDKEPEVSGSLNRSYADRQAAYSSIADDYQHQGPDAKTYFDSYENTVVKFPAAYGSVWTGRAGGYLLSQDPEFDPNENGEVIWERLKATGAETAVNTEVRAV